MFLFGFFRSAMGGPPFCFVTGVCAGFGYNRALRFPDRVQQIRPAEGLIRDHQVLRHNRRARVRCRRNRASRRPGYNQEGDQGAGDADQHHPDRRGRRFGATGTTAKAKQTPMQ